jgi:hypothetical protein
MAQPVIDGKLLPPDQAFYGAAKFTQDKPTTFCDNTNVGCISVGGGVRIAINNSNTAGVPGGGGALLDAMQQAAAAAVTTGLEVAIPLAQLGNPAGGTVLKIAGWVNGGGSDYLSNQLLGGFTTAQGNLGGNGSGGYIGDLSGIDLTAFPGNQFITVTVPGAINTAPITIDGTVDAAYGQIRFIQTNETQFGDGTAGGPECPGSGSEIAGAYATIANADLGQGPQNYLFIFVTGNLECNFNRLNLFIDSGTGGFNQIPDSPCLPNADGLAKHRLLKFDAGFNATHYVSVRNGGGPFGIYADFSQVALGGSGGYIGGAGVAAPGIVGTGSACPPSDTASTGSELNQVFSRLDRASNRLYVLVTGNLKENVFLHLFLDTRPGGQNSILDNNPIIGIADGSAGHLGRFGPATLGGPALTFDTSFAADYWLASHFENGIRQVIDAAVLNTNGRDLIPSTSSSLDFGSYQGVDSPGVLNFDGTNFDTFTNPPAGIQNQDGFVGNVYSSYAPRESRRVHEAFILARGGYVPAPDNAEWTAWVTGGAPLPDRPRANLIIGAFNNSNVGGVTDTSAAAAATATAGFEYSLDLGEIGYTGGPIKLAGFISDSGTTRVSNQVIGGSGSDTNLGDPRNINFSTIAGSQYAIVFCPQDHNQSGSVSVQDIFDFLSDYFAGSPQADYNFSGTVSVQDIFDFLSGYFSGNCQ